MPKKRMGGQSTGSSFLNLYLRLTLVSGEGKLYEASDTRFTLGDVLGLHVEPRWKSETGSWGKRNCRVTTKPSRAKVIEDQKS